MSVRLRLTLLYSAILALTLIAFSAILYTAQAQYTMSMMKRDLSISAMRIATGLARVTKDMSRRGPTPWLWRRDPAGGMWTLQALAVEVEDLRTRDSLRFLDADGALLDVDVNQEVEDLPLSQEGLAQVQARQPWSEIVPGEEGRWLVHSQPVQVDDEVVGIVQVARFLADRDRSLRGLGGALILGSLLTTVVAFGIGWVLSGMTLQPIHRITQTAQQIGQERDFASRVHYKGPNDELGRLATTFNGMLSRLQEAYQRVAHALEVQRGFVTDVSHELRTPLTTIRGNLALLRREPPLPRTEREDILDDLVEESDRLTRLVSDLLTLARADAGRKLECDRVPVRPLVDDVCRQARVLGPGREIECEGSDDVAVLADDDALKQVLLILLDNAIKHAEGTIRIVLGEYDRQVEISVKDSGPGMSPELRERIFDRFYRGDTSRSTPGFGLGLSIAKALVEAQHGVLTVESQMGQGSVFRVALPQADSHSAV